jgi:hypothetical protein
MTATMQRAEALMERVEPCYTDWTLKQDNTDWNRSAESAARSEEIRKQQRRTKLEAKPGRASGWWTWRSQNEDSSRAETNQRQVRVKSKTLGVWTHGSVLHEWNQAVVPWHTADRKNQDRCRDSRAEKLNKKLPLDSVSRNQSEDETASAPIMKSGECLGREQMNGTASTEPNQFRSAQNQIKIKALAGA